ncbi:hypothetical protein MMC20_003084 [Loxospora ochrophaea]|nr:hypothetical protein [Loxospora ochrophaea]
MQTGQSYNPPIRVHQSTPSPEEPPSVIGASQLMLNENTFAPDSWSSFKHNNQINSQTLRRPFEGLSQTVSSHKRASSGSSVGSVGPASPHTPTTSFPQIVDSDAQSLPSPGFDFYEAQSTIGSYSKPPPTPSHSSGGDCFLAPQFQDYNPSIYNAAEFMAVQNAMRQAMMESQDRMSHGSPASRMSYGEDQEDGFKAAINSRHIIPKLDRTMSDVYQDELYNPVSSVPAPPSQPRVPNNQKVLLSPYRTVFSERLQAAHNRHIQTRSSSPATTVSRERSPFRPGSDFATEGYSNPDSPGPRLASAVQRRENPKAEEDAVALANSQALPNDDLATPTTISPKEVALDYQSASNDLDMPLFSPDNTRTRTNGNSQFAAVNPRKRDFSQVDADANGSEKNSSGGSSRRHDSSDFSTSSTPMQPSNFTFIPPTTSHDPQNSQQYPFISHSRRQSSTRSGSDQVPEFTTPHLTSMETTKSDNSTSVKIEDEPPESSPEVQRPDANMADDGTYTCTYHGCTLRFETQAKLQRHKRDGHRQDFLSAGPRSSTTPSGNGSIATAAAINRNSQAGPHVCERINPSTGKPCNSVFSRPYDLTRHEDTIHNARKQKVRCQLCTEEKTFSRNDALTRHMRVVHPEVDFPGKTKRRGGT